jgi:hypothetical protein
MTRDDEVTKDNKDEGYRWRRGTVTTWGRDSDDEGGQKQGLELRRAPANSIGMYPGEDEYNRGSTCRASHK